MVTMQDAGLVRCLTHVPGRRCLPGTADGQKDPQHWCWVSVGPGRAVRAAELEMGADCKQAVTAPDTALAVPGMALAVPGMALGVR